MKEVEMTKNITTDETAEEYTAEEYRRAPEPVYPPHIRERMGLQPHERGPVHMGPGLHAPGPELHPIRLVLGDEDNEALISIFGDLDTADSVIQHCYEEVPPEISVILTQIIDILWPDDGLRFSIEDYPKTRGFRPADISGEVLAECNTRMYGAETAEQFCNILRLAPREMQAFNYLLCMIKERIGGKKDGYAEDC